MNGKNHDVEKRRYWQRTIGDAARSGMSIREFCRQHRLKESQFYWWQRKLKTSRQERNKPISSGGAASFLCKFFIDCGPKELVMLFETLSAQQNVSNA